MQTHPMLLKTFKIIYGFALALTMALSVTGARAQPAKSGAAEPPANPEAEKSQMTAQERLAACALKYAEAKTYRDEGVLLSEFEVSGVQISDTKPFTTAFERDGRFHWQFSHAPMPGGRPSETYTIWSDDQKSFNSYWTLMRSTQTFDDFGMALGGPTGVSGGSATAINPLLVTDLKWGIRLTELPDATETGTEKIDGHECTKIEGKNLCGQVTLWLDETLAIRKIHQVTEIDPSTIPLEHRARQGGMEKFTVTTTITLSPVFDEAIDARHFDPPAKRGAGENLE